MSLKRQEIEKMEAGREMDALVAAKIFKVNDIDIFYIDYDPEGNKFADGINESIPNYSTSIAVAFQVVEKHGRYSISSGEDGCEVILWDQGFNPHTINTSHKEAPLAICKAALLSILKK